LFRRGISGSCAWCRECKAHTDIVHCHLLFHLPVEYRVGAKLDEIKSTLDCSDWPVASTTFNPPGIFSTVHGGGKRLIEKITWRERPAEADALRTKESAPKDGPY
jgi:hypothetical protein